MINKKKKKLLLHVCCAPCLTSVFEQLKEEFDVTLFWWNANISPKDEYDKRLEETKRYSSNHIGVKLIEGDKYQEDNLSWTHLAQKYDDEPEGGVRCKICIKYRLLVTAKYASENNFDAFATTLSVSPHKDSRSINNIGLQIATQFPNLKFIDQDFKKNNGYKRSIELCKEFGIYRQNYCGCVFSQKSGK